MGTPVGILPLSGRNTQGDLQHEHHQDRAPSVPKADENEGHIPERKQPVKAVVSGTTERAEKMDDTHPELASDAVSAGDIF